MKLATTGFRLPLPPVVSAPVMKGTPGSAYHRIWLKLNENSSSYPVEENSKEEELSVLTQFVNELIERGAKQNAFALPNNKTEWEECSFIVRNIVNLHGIADQVQLHTKEEQLVHSNSFTLLNQMKKAAAKVNLSLSDLKKIHRGSLICLEPMIENLSDENFKRVKQMFNTNDAEQCRTLNSIERRRAFAEIDKRILLQKDPQSWKQALKTEADRLERTKQIHAGPLKILETMARIQEIQFNDKRVFLTSFFQSKFKLSAYFREDAVELSMDLMEQFLEHNLEMLPIPAVISQLKDKLTPDQKEHIEHLELLLSHCNNEIKSALIDHQKNAIKNQKRAIETVKRSLLIQLFEDTLQNRPEFKDRSKALSVGLADQILKTPGGRLGPMTLGSKDSMDYLTKFFNIKLSTLDQHLAMTKLILENDHSNLKEYALENKLFIQSIMQTISKMDQCVKGINRLLNKASKLKLSDNEIEALRLDYSFLILENDRQASILNELSTKYWTSAIAVLEKKTPIIYKKMGKSKLGTTSFYLETLKLKGNAFIKGMKAGLRNGELNEDLIFSFQPFLSEWLSAKRSV